MDRGERVGDLAGDLAGDLEGERAGLPLSSAVDVEAPTKINTK